MAINGNEDVSGISVSRRVEMGSVEDGVDRVVLLTGMDQGERDTASFALRELCPASCAITYDVRDASLDSGDGLFDDAMDEESADGEPPVCGIQVQRTVHASDGRVITKRMPLRGCCLTCAIKSDVEREISRMGRMAQRFGHHGGLTFIVALPVGLEAFPIAVYCSECFAFAADLGDGESRPAARLAAMVTVTDEARLRDRLFGMDVWESRDPSTGALVADDDRSVGVVAASLLRESSHVLMLGRDSDNAGCGVLWLRELVGQVCGRSVPVTRLADVDAMSLIDDECRMDEVSGWLDPMTLGGEKDVATNPECGGVPLRLECARDGFESVVLRSVRPVHPGRLSDFLDRLESPVHIRGHFMVPTKPFSVFAIDGGPGCVGVEELDDADGEASKETVLCLVAPNGTEVSRKVCDLLLTNDEMALPSVAWFDQVDEFTLWSNAAVRGDGA